MTTNHGTVLAAPDAVASHSRGVGGEAPWFAVAAAAFIAAELGVLRAWIVVTRPLWLDEIHTRLVAQSATVSEVVRNLAAGADFNPPTVFLLYRAIGALAGGLSETTMRMVAALCVVGALTTVFVLLRERFSRPAAASGVLAVWSQSVVVNAAFEARFYGPWLLAAGCLLLALRRAVTLERQSWGSSAALAIASIAVCTVHYFGIVSWAAAIAVAVLRVRRNGAATVRLLPALAGPVATAACIPLYLDQRAALTVATWIPPVTVAGVLLLLSVTLLPPPTIAAVVCGAVESFARRPRPQPPHTERGFAIGLGPALLLGQVAVPITLAIFSLIVQPATQPRYWIVGAFAAAPIVALAVSFTGPVLATVVGVTTLVWSASTVRMERGAAEAHARRIDEDAAVVASSKDSGALVVARRRHTIYPLLEREPTLRSRLALFDASATKPDDAFMAVERDVATAHRRLFGFPRIVTPAGLDSVQTIFFLELDSTKSPTRVEFPHHEVTRIARRAYVLDRR